MLKKIAVFGLVTLNTILLNFPAPIVKAQEFNAFTCIKVNGYDSSIRQTNDVISVGKRIRRPIYYITLNSYEATCEIQDEKVTKLNFSLAMPDNSKLQMAEFSVFLEGNLAKKVKVKRGTQLTFSVPLNGSKNFAIEAQKLQGDWGILYFLKYEAQ